MSEPIICYARIVFTSSEKRTLIGGIALTTEFLPEDKKQADRWTVEEGRLIWTPIRRLVSVRNYGLGLSDAVMHMSDPDYWKQE